MRVIRDPAVAGDLDVSACFDNAKAVNTRPEHGGGPAGPVAVRTTTTTASPTSCLSPRQGSGR